MDAYHIVRNWIRNKKVVPDATWESLGKELKDAKVEEPILQEASQNPEGYIHFDNTYLVQIYPSHKKEAKLCVLIFNTNDCSVHRWEQMGYSYSEDHIRLDSTEKPTAIPNAEWLDIIKNTTPIMSPVIATKLRNIFIRVLDAHMQAHFDDSKTFHVRRIRKTADQQYYTVPCSVSEENSNPMRKKQFDVEKQNIGWILTMMDRIIPEYNAYLHIKNHLSEQHITLDAYETWLLEWKAWRTHYTSEHQMNELELNLDNT